MVTEEADAAKAAATAAAAETADYRQTNIQPANESCREAIASVTTCDHFGQWQLAANSLSLLIMHGLVLLAQQEKISTVIVLIKQVHCIEER